MAIAQIQGDFVHQIILNDMINRPLIGSCFTFIFLATILVTGNAEAQVKVSRVTDPAALTASNGVVYSLPMTVLEIDLEVKRTDTIPGPYASFALEILGIQNAVQSHTTGFELVGVTVGSHPVSDPTQVFLVEMEEKSSEPLSLEFESDGMILGRVSSGGLEPTGRVSRTITDDSDLSVERMFPAYKPAAMIESVDTIVRTVVFDTLIYSEKILKRLMVKQSEKDQAIQAASLINDIGQDLYGLLVGYQETPYSVDALKYMTGKLEEQRKSYLQLFTGVVRTEHFHVKYSVVPLPESISEPVVLTGFSSSTGIVKPNGNNEIILKIQPEAVLAGTLGGPAGVGPKGYFYRIPATCDLTVLFEKKPLMSKSLPINQAGVIRALPSSVTQVEFDPVTGGLRKVILK